MRISRRDFLRAATLSATAIGLNASSLLKLQEALAGVGDAPVIWLEGQGCGGCTLSLLNSVKYDSIDIVLRNKLSLEYHSMLMACEGDLAVSAADEVRTSLKGVTELAEEWLEDSGDLKYDYDGNGKVDMNDFTTLSKRSFILVVEGAIPTNESGHYCHITSDMTMYDALGLFATHASHVVAVGTCASFGGIPAATNNQTGAISVQDALSQLGISKPLVNIPGCPAHPDWIIGTLIQIITSGSVPVLDSELRPVEYFPAIPLHSSCPYYGENLTSAANHLGEKGCLINLGCRGMTTHADCPSRRWNSGSSAEAGINWCIASGAPCHGCTEPDYPGDAPFYTNIL